jgi:carbamoyltransferase
MKLLAIRSCAHDSNFSYFDGERVHYFKSERLAQVKHHAYQNIWEWQKVIKEIWNLDYQDIDEMVVVFDPWYHNMPSGQEEFVYPAVEYHYFPAKCKVWKIHHHCAHAYSTWMLDDREPSIQFMIDGYGEPGQAWTIARGDKVIAQGDFEKHGSIGYALSEMGQILGIQSQTLGQDIAGKLMGLQSYGNVDYEFLEKIKHLSIYNIKLLYNIQLWYAHKPDGDLKDWARTVHLHTGNLLVDIFKQHAKPDEVISYSGGVAQNIIWNTQLRSHFKNILIPPHGNDEGLSLGALEWLRIKLNLPKFKMDNFPFCQFDEIPGTTPTPETIKRVAQLLADGKTVAWYQGSGEVGPRALGNRSILMSPLVKDGKTKINTIKRREFYRPFGASILNEFREEYFDLPYENPYMLYVANAKIKLDSITHVDGTCRAQTVKGDSAFRKLLEEFHKITGCPVLLNTSLNLAGKPIAGYIQNAVDLFNTSALDVLVVGDKVVEKSYNNITM